MASVRRESLTHNLTHTLWRNTEHAFSKSPSHACNLSKSFELLTYLFESAWNMTQKFDIQPIRIQTCKRSTPDSDKQNHRLRKINLESYALKTMKT